MHIEFFTVAGKYAEVEQELRKVVEDLKGRVDKPDKVRLAIVKIREESLGDIMRYLGEPIERTPPQYRSLVAMLKRYEIGGLPALVLNGVKIFEGEGIDLKEVTSRILEEAEREFGVRVREAGEAGAIPRAVSAEVKRLEIVGAPKFVLGRPDDCTSCVYYGEETSTCFLLMAKVVNARSPPCKT